MSATGRSDVRRADDDCATPGWATRAILSEIRRPLDGSVLDPCCGSGRILDEVRGVWGLSTAGIEMDRERAGVASMGGHLVHCADAMGLVWGSPSALITNPPYSWALEFVERAREQCPDIESAFLLRLNWLGSQRRAAFLRTHPPDVYVLPKRPSFTNGGTDATEYAWMVWGPGRGGRWKVLVLP